MTREERNIIFSEAKRAVRIQRPENVHSVASAVATRAVSENNMIRPSFYRATVTTITASPLPHSIVEISVATGQAGLIWVMCFGVNPDGDTYAAIKQVQFKNLAGLVTFGTVTDTMTPEITATGADMAFDGDASSFYINLFGQDTIEMNWEVNYQVIIQDIPGV